MVVVSARVATYAPSSQHAPLYQPHPTFVCAITMRYPLCVKLMLPLTQTEYASGDVVYLYDLCTKLKAGVSGDTWKRVSGGRVGGGGRTVSSRVRGGGCVGAAGANRGASSGHGGRVNMQAVPLRKQMDTCRCFALCGAVRCAAGREPAFTVGCRTALYCCPAPQVLRYSSDRVEDSCKPLHVSEGGPAQGMHRALAPRGL